MALLVQIPNARWPRQEPTVRPAGAPMPTTPDSRGRLPARLPCPIWLRLLNRPLRHQPCRPLRPARPTQVIQNSTSSGKTSNNQPARCGGLCARAGEVPASHSDAGILTKDVESTGRGILVADFGIDWRSVKERRRSSLLRGFANSKPILRSQRSLSAATPLGNW